MSKEAENKEDSIEMAAAATNADQSEAFVATHRHPVTPLPTDSQQN